MSLKERVRLDAMNRLNRKELTVVAAAELAGVSLRQMRRLWKRFQVQGESGLLHRLRGRSSNRGFGPDFVDRVVKLHQEKYADFGQTLACEKLAEPRAVSTSFVERSISRYA